jgi:hypothetical protein
MGPVDVFTKVSSLWNTQRVYALAAEGVDYVDYASPRVAAAVRVVPTVRVLHARTPRARAHARRATRRLRDRVLRARQDRPLGI